LHRADEVKVRLFYCDDEVYVFFNFEFKRALQSCFSIICEHDVIIVFA
jgi:hypothetical protein